MDANLYANLLRMIYYYANRYSAKGHYALDHEELVAEGHLVIAEVAKKVSFDEPENFIAVFRVALVHHYIILLDTHRYSKKRGFGHQTTGEVMTDTYIDLSDIEDILGYNAFDDVFFREYVAAVKELLVDYPDAAVLFDVCVDPPARVELIAIAESKRRAYMARVQGKLLRNAQTVRIRKKHIAEYLGWSMVKLSDNLKILTSVVFEVLYA